MGMTTLWSSGSGRQAGEAVVGRALLLRMAIDGCCCLHQLLLRRGMWEVTLAFITGHVITIFGGACPCTFLLACLLGPRNTSLPGMQVHVPILNRKSLHALLTPSLLCPPAFLAGLILQFDLFLNNNYGLLFFLFFLFQLAMSSFALACSTFLQVGPCAFFCTGHSVIGVGV